MSASIERRVGWVPAVAGRLFGGAGAAGWPPAWLALVRDPVQLGEVRLGELLDTTSDGGELLARRLGAEDVAPRDAGVRPAPRGFRTAAPVEPYGSSGVRADGRSDGPFRAETRPAGSGWPASPGVAAGAPNLVRHADRSPAAPTLRALPGSAARMSSAYGRVVAPDRAVPATASEPAARRPIAPAGIELLYSDAATSLAEPVTSRLVHGAAGLGRLLALAPGRAAIAAPGRRADVPRPVDAAWPEPLLHRQPPEPALPPFEPLPPGPAPGAAAPLDLDTILEALTDRLRVDYLRHYGSAG